MVGDTTSILLGSYGHLDFFDFFWLEGRPGIFWVVELGALATIPVLLLLFRSLRQPIQEAATTKVTNYVPTWLLLGVVALLIAASFWKSRPALTNGYICMGLFLIGLVHATVSSKGACLKATLQSIDYQTLLLLASLFVIIQAITNAGVIDAISDLFLQLGGDSLFVMYTILVFASVLISAFIDNIPYVATMLPVVSAIATSMGRCALCPLFWPSHRGHPGRQSDPHRRLGQRRRHTGHPAQGRLYCAQQGLFAHWHPLHPSGGLHRLYRHLADLVIKRSSDATLIIKGRVQFWTTSFLY